MAKFHINPETGAPGPCTAKKACPFGGDSEHFPTQVAARNGFELVMRIANQDPTAAPRDHGISFSTREDAERIAHLVAREGQPAFVETSVTVIYSDADRPDEDNFDDLDSFDAALAAYEEDFQEGRLAQASRDSEYIVHSFPNLEAAKAFEESGSWGGGFAKANVPAEPQDGVTYVNDVPISDSLALAQNYTDVTYFAPKGP